MSAGAGAGAGADLVVPGANTLRGGTNTYAARTLNSGWVEDRYDPRFPGVRKHAATEQMERQLEATAKRVPMYGTGLPGREAPSYDKCIDYGNVINYDKRESAGTWESVTKSTYAPPAEAKATEFSTTFKSKPHVLNSDPSTTAEYRKRWITGDKGGPARRFETTLASAMSAPVAAKYKTSTTRSMPGVPKAVEVFRAKITERGGANGIRTIGRMFRVMDDSGDKRLSKSELRYGLIDYGLAFSVDEFEALWRYLDRDASGSMDYDEFLRGVRGEMNDARVAAVRLAWGKLESTGDGVVTVADLEGVYDPSFHPDVESGKLTPKQALEQFLTQWDTVEKDGVVTFEEFCEYYNNVSASIDRDDYFELMIRNAWHIAGGEGWAANTTNLRVLVTHADGTKTIETVENDLGLKADDVEGIKTRLARQGVADVVAVSTHF